MHRSAIFALMFGCAGLLAAPLGAQTTSATPPPAAAPVAPTLQHSELAVQLSGVFTSNSNNTPTTHLATNSAGLLVDYTYHFNNWEGLGLQYGYTNNGQRYFTPGTTPGAPGVNYAVTASMQQFMADEVVSTPRLLGLRPFLLAGGGAVYFRPRSGSAVAASSQTKGAFNYGVGLDFSIYHVGARVEYQGLIFKLPDFGNPLLTVNKWTHVAQPSIGLVFTW